MIHGAYRAQEEELDRLQELRRELRRSSTPQTDWRKLPAKNILNSNNFFK